MIGLIPSAQGQLKYILDNGTITITGYGYSSGPNLVIPSTINGYPVTSIGGRAFYNQNALFSVTIPNSIISIGPEAFYNSHVAKVTIPDGVTSIAGNAFGHCNYLTSVTISSTITNIGSEAFSSCSSLTNITVNADNSNFASVGGVLFNKSLTTLIQFPGRLFSIYSIPGSVTSIADKAFFNCWDLTSVEIPNSVTSIGDEAFSDCSRLTNITVDAANPSFASAGGVLFNKRLDQLIQFPEGMARSYAIPGHVTSIGNKAFFD
jgi:hypothetical protein